ncbi:abortive infection family protein [Bacillus pretiosus]|uniref:abortive infection family protein n=1 Tax=Bacillus pretiosus TaxID=2983392 RepID=UPI000BF54B24|nr:hypothetical protein CN485_04850 [Bacillus cereus]PEY99840.1 hypothetical protein CN349_14510 [Bacillus cereus]PGP71042.1 hypothetical protein CN998_04000 [Bacillus cereus]
MFSETALFLNKCKKDLQETYEAYLESNHINGFQYNYIMEDVDYQKARRIVLKLRKEEPALYTSNYDFINECINVSEVMNYIAFYISDNNFYTKYSIISEAFNPYIDYIEEKQIELKIMHVNCDIPQGITYEQLVADLSTCERRIINGEYKGAISLARTTVEGVLKQLIRNITGEDVGQADFPALNKKVKALLKLNAGDTVIEHDPQLTHSLKRILSGLSNIVDGLNEIRNMGSEAHYNDKKVALHHALLVLNSAKTLIAFLYGTYEYQRDKGKLNIG